MPVSVVGRNECLLDGTYFRLEGGVRRHLASQFPGKVTFGDFSQESHPIASSWTVNDHRGGIGIDIMDPARDHDRSWWSTCNLRHRGHLVLQRRARQTAAGPDSDIGVLAELDNELYATYADKVHIYDNDTDDWGDSVRTLSDNATDAVTGVIGGTVLLVIATGDAVDYTDDGHDGDAWARNTRNISYLAIFRDLLWGIDSDGVLFHTDDLGEAWTEDARLAVSPQALLVGTDTLGEQALYASTRRGLYVFDDVNNVWLETDLQLPFHPSGGLGPARWRGALNIPAGQSVYNFRVGNQQTVITLIGPDRDDGLPEDMGGVIRQLVGTHNEILAVMDATGVSSGDTNLVGGLDSHDAPGSFGSQIGFSNILGWDERGWQVVWVGSSVARPIVMALVSNAYSTYRLWWAADQRVWYMQLPTSITNPRLVTDTEYASEGVHETPWFDAAVSHIEKVALRVIVETHNPTPDETVRVEFATDFSDTYTLLGTINETGEHKFPLPSAAEPKGLVFRTLRFRLTLNRGSEVTNTPDVIKLTLVFEKTLEPLYGFDLTFDLTETFHGLTPTQQLERLSEIVENRQLQRFTYRDNNGEREHWVRVLQAPTLESTGHEDHHRARVALVEPI